MIFSVPLYIGYRGVFWPAPYEINKLMDYNLESTSGNLDSISPINVTRLWQVAHLKPPYINNYTLKHHEEQQVAKMPFA